MSFDSVIFDVDGTLWNSCDQVANIWAQAASEYTGERYTWTGKELETEFGKTMDAIMEDLLPQLTREQQKEVAELCFRRENVGLKETPGILYPGVAETVRTMARKHRLFIVSNCQKGYIEILLDSYGLRDCFQGWLCWEDTHEEKNVTIERLMAAYDLKNPVYVGDTQGDLNACRTAGIPMIFAAYGLGSADRPDWTINSFDALPELLQKIG